MTAPGLKDEAHWPELAMNVWDDKVVQFVAGICALGPHLGGGNDLVLRVHRSQPYNNDANLDIKTFDIRASANAMSTQVDAVCDFHPGMRPTNIAIRGIPAADDDPTEVAVDISFKMNLHRDLLRGIGFWPTLRDFGRLSAPLSMIDFLDIGNEDRGSGVRGPTYRSSKRHLGLGLITGPPGFGKTTAWLLGPLV
ncbi:Fc.00g093380.m01.CDS01 [Cosmosporella sp. VM-42]